MERLIEHPKNFEEWWKFVMYQRPEFFENDDDCIFYIDKRLEILLDKGD